LCKFFRRTGLTPTEDVEQQIEIVVGGLAHFFATPVSYWLNQSMTDLGRWVEAGNKLTDGRS
jgi:hypothetical protein